MTPLICRLQEIFSDLPFTRVEKNPLEWTFTESIKKLGPDFYQKIVPLHLVLNLEYSLLGQQLRAKFLSKDSQNKDEIVQQLIAALMLSELLEHVYKFYLIVPREVARLRQQQSLYRELLSEILKPLPDAPKLIEGVSSFTQQVRNTTISVNLYRLLFLRSKRMLDLFAALDSVSNTYRKLVQTLDKYTDPFLPHLAWLFFLPRLSVNLFLLLKHTLPTPWMGEEEKSLGWLVRFNAQMKRRWFELGNDIAWATVGVLNCFYLTGSLAPIGAYLSIACFAFDVLMSATRAYIELSRLYELQNKYTEMKSKSSSLEEIKEIDEHLKSISKQIDFERFRLGSHLTTTTIIFFAMCCTSSLFAFNPIVSILGSMCLVTICFINFALAQSINDKRPRDNIEIPSGVARLGFFAKKEPVQTDPVSEEQLYVNEAEKIVRC